MDTFWKYVDKCRIGGCWLWTGAKTGVGYGSFRGKGAHRVSWERHHGRAVPGRKMVLHRCDNRACVNPDHLFLGSQLDNVRDMMAKGRGRGRGSYAEGKKSDS